MVLYEHTNTCANTQQAHRTNTYTRVTASTLVLKIWRAVVFFRSGITAPIERGVHHINLNLQ